MAMIANVDKLNQTGVTFGELVNGDVFTYCGTVYVKVEGGRDLTNALVLYSDRGAVPFHTATLEAKTPVEIMDAVLTVKKHGKAKIGRPAKA